MSTTTAEQILEALDNIVEHEESLMEDYNSPDYAWYSPVVTEQIHRLTIITEIRDHLKRLV